jgi:hypothetical protein
MPTAAYGHSQTPLTLIGAEAAGFVSLYFHRRASVNMLHQLVAALML